MQSSPVRIVFTDLDGTLLNTERTVGNENLDCLKKLGQRKIIRVIATGRSRFSFKQIINRNFPADYLIFSSGAGVVNLHNDEVLACTNLSSKDIAIITKILQKQKADFMVHSKAPDNHHFVYSCHNSTNTDFHHRIRLYQDFATPHGSGTPFPTTAAQIIAVLGRDDSLFHHLKSHLKAYQVTRTTSPLDHSSIWMEIQPRNVHKGSAAAWLCNHLSIAPSGSVGIGNDYNDLDLLDFTYHSYLLQNAPNELHHRYHLSPSNDDHGFSYAVYDAIAALQR